jgi:RND family efflux transporter MFP subunit
MIANRRMAIALALVVVGAWTGCRRVEITTPLVAVQTAKLKQERLSLDVRFTATVREQQRIELSFKVPGTVKSLLQVQGLDGKMRDIHEGDPVTSDVNHPLAMLDDSDYQRQVSAAEERLAQAEAMERSATAIHVDARATFERMKGLFEKTSIARQGFDDALAKRDSSEASLDAAKRQVRAAMVALHQAQDDLKQCKLVLPIPQAVVSRKNIEGGERVPAGHPVMQVMDLSRVRVAFGVPDTKFSQFKMGQTVDVVAEAFPSDRFVGQITKIVPAADMKTRTFELEVTITEPKGLRPGMVVTILVGRDENVVLVPMTAVHRGEQQGECYVYTVVEEGGQQIARQRRVILGGVYDNRLRIIKGDRSQVWVGDPIVVAGSFRLADGLAVREIEAQTESRQAGM